MPCQYDGCESGPASPTKLCTFGGEGHGVKSQALQQPFRRSLSKPNHHDPRSRPRPWHPRARRRSPGMHSVHPPTVPRELYPVSATPANASHSGDATPSNPRGIPYAPFVDKVEDYVTSRDDVEPTLRSFQEMISYVSPPAPATATEEARHDRRKDRRLTVWQQVPIHGGQPAAPHDGAERQDP